MYELGKSPKHSLQEKWHEKPGGRGGGGVISKHPLFIQWIFNHLAYRHGDMKIDGSKVYNSSIPWFKKISLSLTVFQKAITFTVRLVRSSVICGCPSTAAQPHLC